MDLKMPIKKHKKWITLIACFAATVALTVTVLALTLPGGEQMLGVPTASSGGNLFDGDVPQMTDPADVILPSDQLQVPTASGVTAQPSFALAPEPPTLERNTLKRNDFKKVNGYITCKTEEYWLGIDVSVWQEEIDWERVAAAGVKFAMIRIGYRGWSKQAELQVDHRAEENLKGAMDAGIKVGVYLYSQAINVQEAVEEAKFLLELLDGRPLDMPVVFDWETPTNSSARSWRVKPKTVHACALAFCAEIKAAGYQPMVYFNQSQGKYFYDLEELRAAGIELWLAMYTKAMTYEYKVQMWQYTGEGRVPGIRTKVDIDLYFPYH